MADNDEPHTEKRSYRLPPVDSFEECNDNFATMSEFVSAMLGEMVRHREHTQENLTRIAEEANESMSKFTEDLKVVLSSQSMMFTLCIIALAITVVTLKGLFDVVSKFF
jgi:1,2-phenylacetyl-CoA epoxidase catalytic subunit